jgi:DNA-directed RNA polymerase subunit K/omega
MAHTEIQPINQLDLSNQTANMYKTVVILGTRANQIGGALKQELNSRIAEFATSTDSFEEIVENREQIEIAKHYEGLPKPTLLAVEEFLEGKVEFHEV